MVIINTINSDKPNIRFENMFKRFNNILKDLDNLSINYMIAGGCFKDYFLNVQFKDIDIFFTNSSSYIKAFNYFINELGYNVIFENEKVIKIEKNNVKVDLVKKHFKDPYDLLKSFDFTITQFCIDQNHIFYYNPDAFIDLSKKQLMLVNLLYPKSTMIRVNKYLGKGFKICNEELSKIINKIEDNSIIPNFCSTNIIEYKNNFKQTNYNDIYNDITTETFVEDDNIKLDIDELSHYNFYGID